MTPAPHGGTEIESDEWRAGSGGRQAEGEERGDVGTQQTNNSPATLLGGLAAQLSQTLSACACGQAGGGSFLVFPFRSWVESVFPASLTTAYTLYLQPSERIFDEYLTCSSETR